MGEQVEAKPSKIINVGPDRVMIGADEILIEAKHPMPDWEVRELNPIPVYFEDKKYYLIEKRKGTSPYKVNYLLKPWPQDQTVATKLFHSYDAEIVAERDANLRSGALDDVVRACLMPLYPFLGLLWSRTQQRLVRFGFVPHTITGASIFTVFSLTFAQGVFAVVLINSSIRSGKIMLGGIIRALSPSDYLHLGPISIPVILFDALLLLAFFTDIPVRYARYMHEDQWSGGFLEWVFRRKNK